MMYKIMSTVKAHLNEDKQIVSPTQTLLQNNILQKSELMPEKIRKKILDANVVVEKNSLCRDGVCRGDIYVETSDNLSLIEQRQLVNGMSRISDRLKEPLLSPVLIRNAPDSMPEPAISAPASQHVGDAEIASAFVGSRATLVFPSNTGIKSSYKKADTIAKALNSELNLVGLRTVFADMSICSSENPVVRDCYVLMQKTSRFNHDTFSNERLITAITNGFNSPKLGAKETYNINIIPTEKSAAIIGSVSLENVQMAGKRVTEQLKPVSNLPEAALAFVNIEQNPLFVNGVGCDGEKAIKEVVERFNVPRYPRVTESSLSMNVKASSSAGFYSSTEQDLSTKWKNANAFGFSLTGNDSQFSALYDNINDIIDSVNDIYGCDENNPVITSAVFNTRTKIKDSCAQSMLLTYNPVLYDMVAKENLSNIFKETLSEYPALSSMIINGNQPQPLMIDLKMSKPVKQKIISVNRGQTINTELKSVMIQDTLENQQEMSL